MILGLVLEFCGKVGAGVGVCQAVWHDLAAFEPIQATHELRMAIELKAARGSQLSPMYVPVHPRNVPEYLGVRY